MLTALYVDLNLNAKQIFMRIQHRLYHICNESFCLLFGTSCISGRFHGLLKILKSQVKCRICCDQLTAYTDSFVKAH